MKRAVILLVGLATLALVTGCEKMQIARAEADALYQTKSQKVLVTMAGGLQTVIMCRNGKIVVAKHTGGGLFGENYDVEELPNTTCK